MITGVDETLDEFGKPKLIISSDKVKTKFIVYKSNDGFAHFKIKYDKGVIPKQLDSAFTSLSLARKAVEAYESSMTMSKKAATEKYYEENH